MIDDQLEIGIRDLRANLSRILDRVRRGDSLVITDRGEPVARLSPPDSVPTLERLVEEGLVQLPSSGRLRSEAYGRAKASGSVSELVSEQRR